MARGYIRRGDGHCGESAVVRKDVLREISVVDVAKLVRQALKLAYPDTKFRVRSSRDGTVRYGGWGASIIVDWFGGPPVAEVLGLVKQYEGSRFDGIGDPFIRVSHWLRPDGTTFIHHAPYVAPNQPEVDNRHLISLMPEDAEAVEWTPSIPWSDDMKIIGEVRWVARTL